MTFMEALMFTGWTLLKVGLVMICVILTLAYLTYAERRIIGGMQDRLGPNRVGVWGLLQPFADVFKMLMKENIVPDKASRFLYMLGPIMALVPAYAAWAVIPFDWGVYLSNANAGLLYVFAMTSLGVYGIIIAGWASNSKYAMYGALRAAAQVVSYELAMGFAIVGVLMAARSLNFTEIVSAQQGGFWHWYFIPLFPLFIVYWISGVAETNRAPFDVVEGESEIVGGCHVEYSGTRFALFFVAEYANMILISAMITLMFMGGWLSPFEGIPVLGPLFEPLPGIIWMFLKMAFFLFFYLWIRATFPRYRYDQIMRLGWKVFIPLTLVWIVVVAVMVVCQVKPWF